MVKRVLLLAFIVAAVPLAYAERATIGDALAYWAEVSKSILCSAGAGECIVGVSTSDASDSKDMCVSGASTCSATRSGYIVVYGNEVATIGGSVLIQGGDTGGGSDITFKIGNSSGSLQFQNTSGGNLFSINGSTGAIASEGTITSARGADLGWSIVDQTDNQACNTGCTSACVAGQDLAGANKPLVGCSDTTADICLCAGAS